jgi:hypothetical protein
MAMAWQRLLTSSTIWVERINSGFTDFTQQVVETDSFGRVEAGGGLIHNDKGGLPQQGLCNAKSLLHSPGIGAQVFLSYIIQIGFLQQIIYPLFSAFWLGKSFQYSKMGEQFFGRYLGINSELLGQIAQHFTQFVGLLQDIYFTKSKGTFIGQLQCGNGPHQRGFSGAVRTQKTKHTRPDLQAYVVDGSYSVAVGFAEILNIEHDEKFIGVCFSTIDLGN